MCAWDLEEPESRHPSEKVGDATVFTRRPAYSTEYLADVATTAAPIVGIATTPRSESWGLGKRGRCGRAVVGALARTVWLQVRLRHHTHVVCTCCIADMQGSDASRLIPARL